MRALLQPFLGLELPCRTRYAWPRKKEVRSLVCPRISMLSWMAALAPEEDPPLLGRLELPLPDASLTSLKDQSWQAL